MFIHYLLSGLKKHRNKITTSQYCIIKLVVSTTTPLKNLYDCRYVPFSNSVRRLNIYNALVDTDLQNASSACWLKPCHITTGLKTIAEKSRLFTHSQFAGNFFNYSSIIDSAYNPVLVVAYSTNPCITWFVYLMFQIMRSQTVKNVDILN